MEVQRTGTAELTGTLATTNTNADGQVPVWLSFRAVVLVITISTAAKFVIGAALGLTYDEAYYTLWSQYLSIAYLDHPPAIAYMVAAGRMLFGNTEIAVRFVPIVCGMLTAIAIWRIGHVLLGRLTGALAAIIYCFIPAQTVGYLATPDSPSAFFWIGTLWAVAEFIISQRKGWWLVAGVLAGLGLWSKYTDAFLPIGLLLFLLVSPEGRSWLKLWQVWAGAALAALIFAPLVWYSWQHDWITFTFQGSRSYVEDEFSLRYLGGLFLGFAIALGPVVAVLAFGRLIPLPVWRRDPRTVSLGLLVWTSVPALAYFLFHALHSEVRVNWPLPLWPSLTLIGAVGLTSLWKRWPKSGATLIAAQLAIGITISLGGGIQLLWQPLNLGALGNNDQTLGWREVVKDLQTLAAENDAKWIATRSSYELTGQLAAHTYFVGSDLPVRSTNGGRRWLFVPPLPETAIGAALFVSTSDAPPDELGTSVPLGEVTRRNGKDIVGRLYVFLVPEPNVRRAVPDAN